MNTYRPSPTAKDCVQCTPSKCPNWPPECKDGEYRPNDAPLNDVGYKDCVAIPDCPEGEYRPKDGQMTNDLIIACEVLPYCEMGQTSSGDKDYPC